MLILNKASVIFVVAILANFALTQDSDVSNEDSAVLLTLNQQSGNTDSPSPDSGVLLSLNGNDLDSKEVSSSPLPPSSARPILSFISSFRSSAAAAPQNRPSLIQSFLAGRGNAAAAGQPRPSPIADAIRNFNITGRASILRERIGRFHIPRIQTNETSFSYRAGRRIGLFFQNIAKRARALAERLRARAATATPTVQ